jgi:hypothetical protein
VNKFIFLPFKDTFSNALKFWGSQKLPENRVWNIFKNNLLKKNYYLASGNKFNSTQLTGINVMIIIFGYLDQGDQIRLWKNGPKCCPSLFCNPHRSPRLGPFFDGKNGDFLEYQCYIYMIIVFFVNDLKMPQMSKNA